MKKKLLIISQTTAGCENGIYKSKEALVQYYHDMAEQWDVSVALPISDRYENFHSGSMDLQKLQVISLPQGIWNKFEIFLRECRRADVVLVFMPTWRGVMCSMIARLTGTRMVIYEGTCWGDWIIEYFSTGNYLQRKFLVRIMVHLVRWVESLQAQWASAVLVTGARLQTFFIQHNLRTVKTQPILLAAGREVESHSTYELTGPLRLLAVGNIAYSKGLDTLLLAVKQVSQHHPVRLTCVGSGKDLRALQEEAKKLDIASLVEFPGYVGSIENLAKYYRNADIFILTSLYEGMPRVLYEAGSFSLPLLTTPVGGVPFFWEDGKDAIFIKISDAGDIARKILALAGDTRWRRQLGEAAALKAQTVLTYPAWKQHTQILQEILN